MLASKTLVTVSTLGQGNQIIQPLGIFKARLPQGGTTDFMGIQVSYEVGSEDSYAPPAL